MTETTDTIAPTQNRFFPALNVRILGHMFIAGVIATTAFDVWGQFISPLIGWATLSPHGLARSLLGALGIPNNNFSGYYVHFFLVGLIGYPVGWFYVFKPIWDLTVGKVLNMGRFLNWFVPSAIYGFGLWVFAIGGITLIAGLPFFLNWTGITWVALIGHVLYGIVLVAALEVLAARDPAPEVNPA